MLNITPEEYASRSCLFENSLDDAYKKSNGVFYTDLKLARLILSYLDLDVTGSIFDPCCGTGSFLYVALEHGFRRVYGTDINADAVKLCRVLTGLNSSAVKRVDTLRKNGGEVCRKLGLKEERVDYVVGNPPYCPIDRDTVACSDDYFFERKVKDSGNNLFIVALYRAFELVKDGGIISYIIPKNFLHVCSYSVLRRYLLCNKAITSIVDLGSYFSNVRGEQVVITIRNSYVPSNKIRLLKLANHSFQETCVVEQSFYSDEILLFQSREEYDVYCKLEGTYMKFSDICQGYVGRGRSQDDFAVAGKDIRKFGFKNRKTPERGNQLFIQNIYSAESGIIASFAGNNFEAKQTVTIFTDSDEKMCRYILGILHSRLCNFYLLKFCYNNSRLTMHVDAKYLSRLPLKKDDDVLFEQIVSLVELIERVEYMSEIWFECIENLNELVYDVYDINPSERSYIDAEMRSLQSNRWTNDK